MNALQQLQSHGQSYWLDNLTRRMIRNGELRRRVREEGLRGITANPATFSKAVTESQDYDEEIGRLVRAVRPVPEIYEQLLVSDVQQACDALREVYDATDGVDGFVSLEVSPYLAHDAESTMKETRRYVALVDRPNLFIKIPGTAAGVPAIEQMLYEGVNINITLLFSIPSYEAVAQAYIRALERRMNEGQSLRVASVASFFLSRIDVLVDQLLSHRFKPGADDMAKQLLGKVAIANAKLAYQSFKRLFSREGWKKLESNGARVQRPLWASTGTKNPDYSDVRYVEPLIGAQTVNTMPEETIKAFADHGKVLENSIEADLNQARRVFDDLERIGIDFRCVTWQLENEGVQKFIDPYDKLMKALEEKGRKFQGTRRAAKQQTGITHHPLDEEKAGQKKVRARKPTKDQAEASRGGLRKGHRLSRQAGALRYPVLDSGGEVARKGNKGGKSGGSRAGLLSSSRKIGGKGR
jgi:transaldolase